MADDLTITKSEPLPELSIVKSEPAVSSGFWDRMKSAGNTFWNTLPGIGFLHQLSGEVQDAAGNAVEKAKTEEQVSAAKGEMKPPTFYDPDRLKQFGLGAVRDVSALVHGVTSPAGVATAAATIAAPEIMGPLLVGHGIWSGVQGWGDLRDPDVLRHELSAGAEVAGGSAAGLGALATKGGPITNAIRLAARNRATAEAPKAAAEAFQMAFPPSKSTPYTPADYEAARPYLEAGHPGNGGVAAARDAADSAIGHIEDQIQTAINNTPRKAMPTRVLQDVKNALLQNTRGQSFVDAGLKELEDFKFGQMKTLNQMDDIRQQLNAENKAVMRKNNYDRATARATDPGFAAREAAAESLRNQIYDTLDANGYPGMASLRLDEGSIIKLRNAMESKIYSGDRLVPASAEPGWFSDVISKLTRLGLTAAGAKIGGVPGAVAGARTGEVLADTLTPKALTRDALADKSFSIKVIAPQAANLPRVVPQPASAAVAAATIPQPQPALQRTGTGP
jgi:hypothetical protein